MIKFFFVSAVAFFIFYLKTVECTVVACSNTTCSGVIEGSFCDSSGTCICESGLQDASAKWCLDLIGKPCSDNKTCVGFADSTAQCLASSVNNFCSCLPGFIENNDLTKCLKIVNNLDNDKCTEHIQCREGTPGDLSSCVAKSPDKVCRCNDNAVAGPENPGDFDFHKCIRIAEKVGDSCVINRQCNTEIGFSHCVNTVCICNDNYVSTTDMKHCLPKKNLGESCSDNVQCNITNAVCQNSTCSCVAGYRHDYPTTENMCYETVGIGQNCSQKIQCPVNSGCDKEICRCSSDYVPSNDNTSCLLVASKFGDQCMEGLQCETKLGLGTGCLLNGTCGCIPDKFVKSELQQDLCIPIVPEINLPCNETVQCSAALGTYANCTHNVCQCLSTKSYYNGKCYIPSALEQPCEKIEQCYAGVNNLTMCIANREDNQTRCRCIPGAVAHDHNRKCYDTNKKVGARCETNEECTVSIAGSVYCNVNSRTCSCNQGHTPDFNNRICTAGASARSISKFFIPILLMMIVDVK